MRALRKTCWGVRQALKHPALEGRKLIGRGVFSLVFEGGRKSTVLKLTIDDSSYWMLNDPFVGVSHWHFPKVVKDHSDIGESRIGKESYPLFLYEVERLEKVKAGSQAKKLRSQIMNAIHAGDSTARSTTPSGIPTAAEVLPHALKQVESRAAKNALKQLLEFSRNYSQASLDMHEANFMQRPNGELVFTDPVFNRRLFNKAHAHC